MPGREQHAAIYAGVRSLVGSGGSCPNPTVLVETWTVCAISACVAVLRLTYDPLTQSLAGEQNQRFDLSQKKSQSVSATYPNRSINLRLSVYRIQCVSPDYSGSLLGELG